MRKKISASLAAVVVLVGVASSVALAAQVRCEPTPESEALCQGTRQDDVIRGTRTGDGIAALPGDDRLYGYAGSDTLVGDRGGDFVSGGLDRDFLGGNAGTDTVRGGLGDDDLIGGRGNDTLQGGDGDDSIWATVGGPGPAPGGVDNVTCGAGTDEVSADAGDSVAADCEDVTIQP